MKKIILYVLPVLFIMTMSGCSEKKEGILFPSDEEIMDVVLPYLEHAVSQDVSTNEGLNANLGLSNNELENVQLFMGMPNQNTTYFCMGTIKQGTDSEYVYNTFETILKSWILTAEQGYISGNTDYEIVIRKDKVFVIMHENLSDFNALKEYLKGLPEKS